MKDLHVASPEFMAYEAAEDKLNDLNSRLFRARNSQQLSNELLEEFKKKGKELASYKYKNLTLEELQNIINTETLEVEKLINSI